MPNIKASSKRNAAAGTPKLAVATGIPNLDAMILTMQERLNRQHQEILTLQNQNTQFGQPIRDLVFKGAKIYDYEGGSRGVYNFFIRQLKKRFRNEGVDIDLVRINLAQTYLKGRPDEIWEAFIKHHPNPDMLTWADFKTELLTQLGNLNNLQRFIKDEYLKAVQKFKKTVLKFSARLNKIREDMSEILTERERMRIFRHGLKPFIRNKISYQLYQTTTHAELLAQAQRIKDTDNARNKARKARQAYSNDLPQQNRNGNRGRRGQGSNSNSNGNGREIHQDSTNQNSSIEDVSAQNNDDETGMGEDDFQPSEAENSSEAGEWKPCIRH